MQEIAAYVKAVFDDKYDGGWMAMVSVEKIFFTLPNETTNFINFMIGIYYVSIFKAVQGACKTPGGVKLSKYKSETIYNSF